MNGAFAKRIDRKKLGGLVFRNEPKRLYFQDRLAGRIVEALGLKLTPVEAKALTNWGTRNARAYDDNAAAPTRDRWQWGKLVGIRLRHLIPD